jgi:hypothetical protein
MTSASPLGTRFVQAAQLLATHVTDHALPEPAVLDVNSKTHQSRLIAQVASGTVASIAAELLAWADTLPTVTVQVWRPPTGHRVHLSMTSTLTGPTGRAELTVYGGLPHDPALLGELAPDEHRAVTLGELRTWAANTSGTNREEASR